MLKRTRHLLIKATYIAIDVILAVGCFYLICWFRRDTLPSYMDIGNIFFDPYNPYRFIFMFWILVSIILNNSYGLYQTKREIYETVELWQVVKSVLITTLITIVAIYMMRIEDFPRSIIFLVMVSVGAAYSVWRILKRVFVEYLVARGYNNFNVLIVGAGKVGTALVKEIQRKPSLGLNVVGYLDDFKTGRPEEHLPPVLGRCSEFYSIARREFIHEVFITIHHDSNAFLTLLQEAKQLGLAIRVIPQGFNLIPSEFYKFNIGFIPILEYSESRVMRQQAGKRLFDFVTAVVLSLMILPACVIISILIKLDSPGPVFYVSRRYGRGGQKFDMYKFRSMVVDADEQLNNYQKQNEADGPIFKIRRDPRVTRVGRFLRKYSLDELPQVLNVLKGEMSLVGPRPLPISQVEREDNKQLQRLEVRPGMTGLWQIRGRSDASFARLVRWDVWYINNWSFGLDLNILIQTIPAVFKGKGAY